MKTFLGVVAGFLAGVIGGASCILWNMNTNKDYTKVVLSLAGYDPDNPFKEDET